jgi:hypothetical protein
MRLKSLALTGLFALALAVPALASPSSPWLHVRVTGADGADNVNLNVPFSIAEGLLQMAENSEINANIKSELPEGLSLEGIRAMWTDLKNSGDAEFMAVQSGEEEVRMAFEGESLIIDVTEREGAGSDTEVKVRVPTRLVDALLSGPGEELDLKAALEVLRDGQLGDIVNVQSADETVRIWMD